MAQVAGPRSTVDRAGTFGWILLPRSLVGALLVWAEHLARSASTAVLGFVGARGSLAVVQGGLETRAHGRRR